MAILNKIKIRLIKIINPEDFSIFRAIGGLEINFAP
jgi:hypothetical protein